MADRSRGFFLGLIRPVQIAVLAIACQAVVTYSGIQENVPAIPDLESLPNRVGEWRVTGAYTLEKDVREYLRPDSYVQRQYGSATDSHRIDLFLAYFKSLKSGYGPHSPAVCLPGAGWLTKSNQLATVRVPDAGDISVNEHWMTKGQQQILVRYWYQNRRHTWAPEIMAKVHLLPDIIRYRRSDVALVRVIAFVSGNDIESARSATSHFIASVFPLVRESMPE